MASPWIAADPEKVDPEKAEPEGASPEPKPSSGDRLTGTLDRYQRRHAWAGFSLAVIYKYIDDSGRYLAALIAYYAFVSLFPLLLLLATLLGYALADNPDLQQRIIGSALAQFPVVGEQLGQPERIGGGAVGLVVGVLVSLYGGLGVAQALQYAMNTAWSVPKNRRPNVLRARGRSLMLLAPAGLAVFGTTVLSTVGTGEGGLGTVLQVLALVASVTINALLFVLVFRIATPRDLSVRDVAPGAIAAAVSWQLLQTFGVAYVRHVVAGASATNGVFAVVLGLLAFLYLTAVIVVVCVEVNVVRVDRLHPRSLLAPVSEDTVLTRGDRRAYTDQAEAQRTKDVETIDVGFDADARDSHEP